MIAVLAVMLLAQARPIKMDFIVDRPSDWIQQPTSIKALRGKVLLIDFFDYSCINCIRSDPYLREWYRRYHDKGLEIVSVHTPEFEFERDPNNVRAAIRKAKYKWHVLNDPLRKNWWQFGVLAWPERILFDSAGVMQFGQYGEGHYGNMEKAIQDQIRALHPGIKLPVIMAPVLPTDRPDAVCHPMTPEIYTWIKGIPGHHVCFTGKDIGKTAMFRYPAAVDQGVVYLSGTWTPYKHFLEPESAGSALELKYMAKEVNVVLAPYQNCSFVIYQDGKPLRSSDFGADVRLANGLPTVVPRESRMYQIVKNKNWKQADLELRMKASGMRFYSFTFSTDCLPRKK